MTSVREISGSEVRCVLPWPALVGESPLWSPKEQRLYWIDIQKKQIHRFNPASGHHKTFTLPEIVTSLALRATGGLLLTLKRHFAVFNPKTETLEKWGAVDVDYPRNRFNDGKCDPQGRFWAGTMDSKEMKKPVGALYCLAADKTITVRQKSVRCSNGMGWSPDGRTMYYTETFRYRTFSYDFDPVTGEISRRRIFASFDSKKGVFPDGMTVDAEGFVWINMVGQGQIKRFDPKGKLERIIQLPVPRPTSCAFGGPHLKTLFVTSARETMTPKQLAKAPLSGSLFAVEGSIKGLPPTDYCLDPRKKCSQP